MGKIIISDVTDDLISNCSLYEYIEETFFREGKPIIVCNVTEEEYKIMERQIADVGCLKERIRTGEGRESYGYNMFRNMMITIRSAEQKLMISNYNNPNQIGSYILRADGISYYENGSQLTNHLRIPSEFIWSNFHIYTTETYEEVVAHYSGMERQKELVKQKTKELIEAIGRNCETCDTPGCEKVCGSQGCGRWSKVILAKDV